MALVHLELNRRVEKSLESEINYEFIVWKKLKAVKNWLIYEVEQEWSVKKSLDWEKRVRVEKKERISLHMIVCYAKDDKQS